MIFRLEYKNKKKAQARLDITTPGSSVVKIIEGTGDPFALSYKGDKSDKSLNFLTSSAEINIYETPEFNIDALKTSNETQIKVDYYIDGSLYWTGFVIPDFFSREIGGAGVVSMVASDRIGTLKGVTLTDLNAFVSLRTLAEQCLLKTGLSLPLNTMVDLEADDVNFFNIDALSQRLVDNKGRSISCYDILSSILVASDSIILQRNAEWYIVNKLQHELGQGKLYSNSTTFTNWQDIIHNFSDVTVGARRTIIPVAASTGVYHEHGGGRLHPDNYDFSKGLTGWSTVGDFTASIDNRQIDGFSTQGTGQAGYFPIYGEATENSYLVNYNQYERNVNPKYLESAEINIPYSGNGAIEVEVDVNATGPLTYPGSSFAPATLRISIIAVSATETLTLDHSGKFITMPSTNPPIFSKDFGKALPVNDVYKADSIGMKVKGTLEVGSLENYKLKIRIYGGTGGRTILVNMVSLSMKNTQETPKGTIFKTEQGSNYTKEHEIDTSIWGDYMTGGLNGYFYNYPIDDTSSLYSNGVLTSKWTDITDPGVERSLLHHITTQRSRMFSQAHDLVSAEMDVRLFDPLSVYVACSKRYTLVSATVDFLRGRANLEIEEAVYQNLTKRDFIYSYFGDGETGVKSIGGISAGVSGGGSGGGMTADQVAILSEVQVLAHDHGNKEVLDQVTQEVVDNALREMIISTDTETELTDENYLSSLRVLKEILDNNEYLGTQFLSKINPDTAQEIIKFVKGIEIGTFTTGPLGAGASLKMENGVSRMEVDQLDVRMRATFRELIIESLKHIGGQLILSPARMKCSKVVDGGTYYKCYFDTGDGKVSNEFVAGDQARCQVFTGSGVKMYWRLVTSVGTDWINLSKTDAISGSSIPEASDDIVQLGNRTDTTRQNAQILSTVGSDAPSWKQYKGINAFSLEGKDTTVFSGTGNKIDGKTVFMSSGANVEDGINSKNSNYSSQPTSYKANDTWTLSADTTVNGVAYKSGEILTSTQDSTTFVQAHWVKKVRYTDDTAINNMQIGGVNLVVGPAALLPVFNPNLTGSGTRSTVKIEDGDSYYTYTPDSGVGLSLYGAEFTYGTNKEYVAGIFVRHSHTANINVTIYMNVASVYQPRTTAVKPNVWTYINTNAFTKATSGTGYIVIVTGSYALDVKKVKIEEGNKPTSWTENIKDTHVRIDNAKQEALTAAGNAQTSANAANTAVGNLNTYVEGSFKDGVIEASEAKAIEKYINVVNTEKSNLEATYNTLYTNTYLKGTPKSDLLNAKVTYFGAVDTLLGSINTAISDGKTTTAEKQAVDTNYSSYKTALASLQTAIENANKAIQTKLDTLSTDKVNNIQVGGRNYVLNSATAVNVTAGASTFHSSFFYVNNLKGKLVSFSATILDKVGFTKMSIGIYNVTKSQWAVVYTDCDVISDYVKREGMLVPNDADSYAIYVYTGIVGQTANCSYVRIYTQIEEGNKATAWREAQEDVQIRIDDAKILADRAQLQADGYMRARYVRDWCAGSSANAYPFWVEVKVILKNGTNIALGKTVSSDKAFASLQRVTDGDINSANYVGTSSINTLSYVQISLGQIYYDIDYIQVWHYYADGRTFYGTKTEISEDGVNWTPVFDSAKSGTYKETELGNIISFRPNEVLAKVLKGAAVTDTFKTTVNGGLISTVMILLRELNSTIETAGVSGIQGALKNYPSMWSGGTYSQALALIQFLSKMSAGTTPSSGEYDNLAKITFLHNGAAKVGDFIIEESGRIVMVHPDTGKPRLVFGISDIPIISELVDGTFQGTSVSNVANLGVPVGTTFLTNTINVTTGGADVSFSTSSLKLIYDLPSGFVHMATIEVGLYRDNQLVEVMGYIERSGAGIGTDEIAINKVYTGMPTGVYKVGITYHKTTIAGSSFNAQISGSTLGWSWEPAEIRYFQFGLNGMMAFFENNHIHFTETGGLDVRGATNMPGILFSAGVPIGGGIVSPWGAKQSSTLPVNNSTGRYTIYHTVGHTNYQVSASPNTANRSFHVVSKGNTDFVIEWRTIGSTPTLVNTAFDFQIIGKNYA